MLLREFVESDGACVFEEGVIKNVVILGASSKNKRRYGAEAMKAAVSLYEGVAVYVNHPSRDDHDRKGRSAEDRFATLTNVKFVEGDDPKLRGDLHHLVSHPMAVRLREDQKRKLGMFGLSHLADGTGKKGEDGVTLVESIDKVIEVDLVTNAATTVSLAEQEGGPPTPDEAGQAIQSEVLEDQALEAGVMAILKDQAIDTGEKMKRVQALFAAHLMVHETEAEGEGEGSEKTSVPEQAGKIDSKKKDKLRSLMEQNEKLAAQIAMIKRRKYLPGGDRNLAEQVSTRVTAVARADTGAFPADGTDAEKASWLRRRRV